MKKKVSINDISWAFLAIILFALGTLGFFMVPSCYEEACGNATLLGCGSLVAFSGGLDFVAGIILYYLLDIDGWIMAKIVARNIKKLEKLHLKNSVRKMEEEER